MTPENLSQYLKANHIKPVHSLGQNFLIDEFVMQDIIEEADVKSNDTVLEIGPGIGIMTKYLLERAGRVMAVERDEQFIKILKNLKEEFSDFRYVIADIRDIDFVEKFSLPSGYKVVANIPYYLTGFLIRLLMSQTSKPKSLTLMVQKEVAQNIVAKPGKLNLLAIAVQLYAEPRIVLEVPARKFFPEPEVNSAVVHINFLNKQKYILEDEKSFFKLLKMAFQGKRKQIHNTLPGGLQIEKSELQKYLDQVKIVSTGRPQDITIEQWVKLFDLLRSQKLI